MDTTVTNFYDKNTEEGYGEKYDSDHGSRIDWVIEKFGLDRISGQRILDAGCGKGNYFYRIMLKNHNGRAGNTYVGIDGANVGKKLCPFLLLKTDLNKEFADILDNEERFDVAICSETLEHLTDCYTCIVQLKKLVKENGIIIITTPAIEMTHNYIYPGLFAGKSNMEQFFQQMALGIEQYEYWGNGWQSHCWKLKNLPWKDARMLFPKNESKFIGKTPLEYVNM